MSSSEERMGPSEGLLAKVGEALKNPYLVWVGGKAPSPRQAAIVCQTLGLTDEEEKQAKAVAVFKRDWPEQFEACFSSASETDTNTESRRREMEVQLGIEHYRKESRKRQERLLDKIKSLATSVLEGTSLFITPYDAIIVDREPSFEIHCQSKISHVLQIEICPALSSYPKYSYEYLKKSRNWAPLRVHVYNGVYLHLAKKFARRYEKRSKQSVTIEKEY